MGLDQGPSRYRPRGRLHHRERGRASALSGRPPLELTEELVGKFRFLVAGHGRYALGPMDDLRGAFQVLQLGGAYEVVPLRPELADVLVLEPAERMEIAPGH